MRRNGCGNFIKYSLLVVNFLIFLGGVIVLSLAIWTIVEKSFLNDLAGTDLYGGAVYVLIATGLLVILLSFFGCVGSLKETRCMLVIYFIALFLIFVTMLVCGILGYVFRGKVETTLRIGMEETMRDYDTYKPAWDETQTRLQCCGMYGPRDWGYLVPKSCCVQTGIPLKCHPVKNTEYTYAMNTKGCLNVSMEYVKTHAAIIGTSGIVVSCLMILGMIFSFALFKLM